MKETFKKNQWMNFEIKGMNEFLWKNDMNTMYDANWREWTHFFIAPYKMIRNNDAPNF